MNKELIHSNGKNTHKGMNNEGTKKWINEGMNKLMNKNKRKTKQSIFKPLILIHAANLTCAKFKNWDDNLVKSRGFGHYQTVLGTISNPTESGTVIHQTTSILSPTINSHSRTKPLQSSQSKSILLEFAD